MSAALQKQVTRDLLPLWRLAATVDAFPALEDVPVGYWPIILTRCELGNHGRVHLDRSGQPYAEVQLRPLWSLAASRACLEMLVNPFETRSVAAPSLRSDQGPVDFMIEVCAPCEDPRNAYVIDGILVSDFCTPAFFGARSGHAERHTARGMLIPAMRPQPGGHMTWYDAISDSFWLRNHWSDNPVDTKLGAVDRKIVSVRELVHACTPLRPMPELHARGELDGAANHARASQRRAQQLRGLLGKRLDQEFDTVFDAVRMDLPPAAPVAAPPAPAEVRSQRASEAREPHAIDIEAGEFEDIDTFVQLLDNLPELEELPFETPAPQAERAPIAPPVAAPAPAPAPVPATDPVPATAPAPAPRVAPAPLLGLSPDDAGRPPSSIAPVTLGSLDERTEPRARAPMVAALAAAAVVGLVWTAVATQAGSRTSQTSAQAARSAASADPAAAPVMPPPTPPPMVPRPAGAAVCASRIGHRIREGRDAEAGARAGGDRRPPRRARSRRSPRPPTPRRRPRPPHRSRI